MVMTAAELQEAILRLPRTKFENSNLAGSSLPFLSSRSAELKALVKEAYKDEDLDIDELYPFANVEAGIAYFSIGVKRAMTFQQQMTFVLENIHKADSWTMTDGIPQYCKKANLAEFKPFFLKLLKKKDVYSVRAAYVIALSFLKEDGAGEFFLSHIRKDDRYYVMMAEAWLLATIAIRDYEKVKQAIAEKKFTAACSRKAISKMMDSFRISPEQKEELKMLRKAIK